MRLYLSLLFLASLLAGCNDTPSREEGPYRVVATVGMIADVVREIAGPLAQVEGLIGEGVDPHLYKPTASDVKAMQAADVVFYNGLLLEGKMTDVLVKLATSGKRVHAVTEGLTEESGYVLTGADEHHDPHVWMDVKGWIAATRVIEEALAEFDSANADTYRTNAAAYRERLVALDDYARKSLGSVPEQQRVLVTAHDAFQYLARAYGIEVRGIQGISTESEAGVKDIEDLVSFLVERKIPAVFIESSVSDKNVRALIEGAAAKGHAVVIGGELFSDAMGSAGTYEGTYLGMIDHNITLITRALGGSAPENGFQGKLSAPHS
ncbi:MAG: zinc ABC transporter substrate-binding protein [Verrucomicrobiae bacterium]|nr:zinc ABC transporter substrate-binding protein [Verrucomicrobiae bacterium]